MSVTEPIKDPFGHLVHFLPTFLESESLRNFEELKQVITDPSFAILVKEEAIYFFRLVGPEVNVLIETCASEEGFIAVNWIENPPVSYISSLLRRGGLVSFS